MAISGTLGSGVGLLLNFKYLFGICIKIKCHGLNYTSLYSMSECRIQNSQCQEFLLIWSWPVWSDSLGSPFWLQCTTVIYKLRHLWIDVRLFQSRGFQVTWTFFKNLSFISAIYPFIFVYQVFFVLKAVSWNCVLACCICTWSYWNKCDFVWFFKKRKRRNGIALMVNKSMKCSAWI